LLLLIRGLIIVSLMRRRYGLDGFPDYPILAFKIIFRFWLSQNSYNASR